MYLSAPWYYIISWVARVYRHCLQTDYCGKPKIYINLSIYCIHMVIWWNLGTAVGSSLQAKWIWILQHAGCFAARHRHHCSADHSSPVARCLEYGECFNAFIISRAIMAAVSCKACVIPHGLNWGILNSWSLSRHLFTDCYNGSCARLRGWI